MVKRIFLFIAVNALVILTVSIVTSALGLQPYLDANGINYEMLLAFCLVWGMVGSFISLALSRVMAKWMMGVKVIDQNTNDPTLQKLVQMVNQYSMSAGIPMPQVGVYESPEVNAFATGPTKSRSLVAVSTGLLQRMDHEAVEGVIGHEIAHIANGDMVTMTLIQGVVNAFVMFLARAVAFAIMQALRSRDDNSEGVGGIAYYVTVIVLEIFFMILGTIVIAWFSRLREFRADAGSAKIAGRDKMIHALESLKRTMEIEDPRHQKPAFQSMKISTRSKANWLRLFSTHPSLDDRIARLSRAV